MEGISIAKLLIIGALIVLLFGTNKLRSLGGDLGSAIKGFKKAMSDDDTSAKKAPVTEEKPAEQVAHKE
ncbi:preprotein translocase subunit SecE [Erwinia typographi]|uniref:Probable Sec-independent protein translocase protein TatE n=1 Tax=Erwinia typographi TaxID=371042 RepID=A0A0A3YUQ4_9GAMM|nr:twin-arginine translocase subunit TatE [Erwinia typographi]KGT90350.1 preprotein translocase subunit SecE [Erwinia typographi]